MIDRFAKMWERQLKFNVRFFADHGLDLLGLSPEDVARWNKEFILHVENELHELLRETSWKMTGVLDSSESVRAKVLEEWVDCLKFLLGLAQVWGFSSDEVIAEFHRKSLIVEERYVEANG
jgi:dimeric dUTPase (all-alpha-NTP-PPase superfamily)